MSLITRCRLIGLALLLGSSAAAAFPDKPVTLVVPAPPGGTADTVVRTLAPRLSAFLGHPVLVENKAGASGVIASQAVAGVSLPAVCSSTIRTGARLQQPRQATSSMVMVREGSVS